MQNEGFCTSIQGEWSLVQREIVELCYRAVIL